MDLEALDHALLEAHEHHNAADLVRLYTVAADEAEQRQDVDAACFYLTHAFVFALESGDDAAASLNKRLADRGRAHPLDF